jgi:hypothetical protein
MTVGAIVAAVARTALVAVTDHHGCAFFPPRHQQVIGSSSAIEHD